MDSFVKDSVSFRQSFPLSSAKKADTFTYWIIHLGLMILLYALHFSPATTRRFTVSMLGWHQQHSSAPESLYSKKSSGDWEISEVSVEGVHSTGETNIVRRRHNSIGVMRNADWFHIIVVQVAFVVATAAVAWMPFFDHQWYTTVFCSCANNLRHTRYIDGTAWN